MTTPIDLASLDSPDVVEALDFETIFAAMLADLRLRDPAFSALVESDPAYKILEVCAYRELLMRQRVNDAAKSVMLAYAGGSDLDHLAALYGVQRMVVDPGDPASVPPVAATLESDTALRRRVQMAPESWTTAGSVGSYRFHTLSANPEIKDVAVSSPAPGEVLVTVLAASGDGTPAAEILAAVEQALTADTVRPLCDGVTVRAADVIIYRVAAELVLFSGPDAEVVRSAAEAAVAKYTADQHQLGRDVAMSGLIAALHQPGVARVALASPAADIILAPGQAAYCDDIDISVALRDE